MGDARIDGHSLLSESLEARRRLGFVPDTPALFDELSVEEHLAFMAGVHRIGDSRSRIRRVLDEMDLASRRHEPASSLSRGLKQRLTLALAFLHEPAALLLDEPFLGLDPPGRRLLEAWISSRAHAGAALLVSSHDLLVLERIATRFVVVHQGRIVVDGTLAELRDNLGASGSLEDLFDRATAGRSS
jgi:ABC-2 type transport system ATP-binding protein